MKPLGHQQRRPEPRSVPAHGHRFRLLVALVIGFFGFLPARAQEAGTADLAELKSLDLEQLLAVKVDTVYAASKYAQKTTDAPASISIVTRGEIRRYGYRTLADVLQSLPGFHVSYDRNYAFLGTRGVNLGDFNSRMLLLIDGHRINNNLTDGAAIGTDFILDLDLIDRVEVIRGPGSVLYGNNAFFGVINVITRKGRQVDGVEVSGEYGSFDTYKVRGTAGKSFANGFEFLLSGTYYDSAGADELYFPAFDTPDQNDGVAEDNDGDRYGSFFGSLKFKDLTLQGGYISREKVNPTAQYFTAFNDRRLSTLDERSYADLKFAHEFDNGFDLTTHVYCDQNTYEIDYPVGAAPSTTMYYDTQKGAWWGAELALSKRVWEKHIILAGADYRDDYLQEKQTSYSPGIESTRQSYGIFAQGDFELLKVLHFNAGVRYDQYGDFDPSWNPRLGLIYNPFPKSTFKALYGSAFRTPNFLELSDPRYQDIQPETIKSYELVYEQRIGEYLRSSVAGFYNQMDDLIVFQSGSFGNLNAQSRGTEVSLEGNWANGIRGRASYTFQKVENESTSQGFTDSPLHLFKFNLSVPLVKEKLFASLEYQYMTSRETVYTAASGETFSGADTDGFGVLNFTLFSQNLDLIKNLDFSVSIYNLLDQSYTDPSTRYHLQDQLPRDGRTFMLKLTYRY
jgi:outer membrane receptor for ferrienterochelin and colicins